MNPNIIKALKTVASKYNVVTKIYEPGERREIGCLKQAELAREMARKQNNSKCGVDTKNELERHAEAIERFYSRGNKRD